MPSLSSTFQLRNSWYPTESRCQVYHPLMTGHGPPHSPTSADHLCCCYHRPRTILSRVRIVSSAGESPSRAPTTETPVFKWGGQPPSKQKICKRQFDAYQVYSLGTHQGVQQVRFRCLHVSMNSCRSSQSFTYLVHGLRTSHNM